MLRHLKMELKRQEEEMLQQQQQQQQHQQQQQLQQQQPQHTVASFNGIDQSQKQQEQKPRRVRGRRSSKPAMEKRRRARINQCLDILKSYVLTDEDNLSQLGVDTSQTENQDEELIARTILKSSGLINRHRGRKNPNKLEKADILELTVDYVRRLHEQRDAQQWLQLAPPSKTSMLPIIQPQKPLDTPLHLQLPAAGGQAQAQATLPSPPPSSASNSPQPLLSISSSLSARPQQLADVLDLSSQSSKRNGQQERQQIHHHGLILNESAQGCWQPWQGPNPLPRPIQQQ